MRFLFSIAPALLMYVIVIGHQLAKGIAANKATGIYVFWAYAIHPYFLCGAIAATLATYLLTR